MKAITQEINLIDKQINAIKKLLQNEYKLSDKVLFNLSLELIHFEGFLDVLRNRLEESSNN